MSTMNIPYNRTSPWRRNLATHADTVKECLEELYDYLKNPCTRERDPLMLCAITEKDYSKGIFKLTYSTQPSGWDFILKNEDALECFKKQYNPLQIESVGEISREYFVNWCIQGNLPSKILYLYQPHRAMLFQAFLSEGTFLTPQGKPDGHTICTLFTSYSPIPEWDCFF